MGDPAAGLNPPDPFPSRIDTLLASKFTTARSSFPSRLKSPLATNPGFAPTGIGDPAGCVKAPNAGPQTPVVGSHTPAGWQAVPAGQVTTPLSARLTPAVVAVALQPL